MELMTAIVFAYFLFLAGGFTMLARYFGLGTPESCLIGGIGGFLGMMLTVYVLANIADWIGGKPPPDKKD